MHTDRIMLQWSCEVDQSVLLRRIFDNVISGLVRALSVS